MKYLKRHKEAIPLIIAALIFLVAAFNLFQDQQKNARLLTKGATLLPSFATGRAACELPIPNLYKREMENAEPAILLKAEKLRGQAESLQTDLPTEQKPF